METRSRKERFIEEYILSEAQGATYSKLVIAIRLPTGATELIVNTDQIDTKVDYYKNAYNDNLQLNANNSIFIVGWLFA